MEDSPHCETPAPPISEKSRLAYLQRAGVLGGFGVHNFYVGRHGRGLFQSLLTLLGCWLLACGMVHLWLDNWNWEITDPREAPNMLEMLANASRRTQCYLYAASLCLLGVTIWVVLEMFLVKTDGQGRRLK